MPAIGNPNGTLVYPSWVDPLLFSRVPKWPHPDTPRVDGRLRWLSDPDLYPIATRYVAALTLEGPGVDSIEQWYWLDIAHDSSLTFKGSSGANFLGQSFDFSIGYHEVLPHLGVPGVRQTFTMKAPPSADASRSYEWTNDPPGYPLNYIGGEPPPDWEEFPFSYSGFPAPYTLRRVRLIEVSECFPCDQLTTTGGIDMPGSIIAQLSKTANQSISPVATNVPIIWDQKDFGFDGFWDSGGDKTKILVPTGINWIRFNANLWFTTSGQCQGKVWKNGAGFVGQANNSSQISTGLTCAVPQGWIPVINTDYLQVIALAAGSTLTLQAGVATSVIIEGTA